MSLLPDHLLVPPVEEFLPQLVGERSAALWTYPGWTVPRPLRAALAPFEPYGDGSAAQVLVVASPIPTDLPLKMIGEHPPPYLIEVGVLVPRALGGLFRPWVRRERAGRVAAERLAQWRQAGLFAPEQWVSLEPEQTLLTWGGLYLKQP